MKNGKLIIFPSLIQGLKVILDIRNRLSVSPIHNCSLLSIKEFCLLVKEHGKDIEKVKCPFLFLHGTNDNVVPIDQVKRIYDSIDNKNKEFIAGENGSHWVLSTKMDDEVYKRIAEFLNKE